jgi:hypothetical protein
MLAKGCTTMPDFGLLVRFISMAERYNTVEYTELVENTLYVYFANGESWKIEFRG